MLKFYHTLLGTALLLAASLSLSGAEPDPARLKAVLAALDLSRPGLESVKSAGTPAAQCGALLKYFRTRPSALAAQNRTKESLSERDVLWSDAALEHRFIGQPAYGLIPRGTPINWDDPYTKDKEWIWQFHRFRWFRSLGNRYAATKDERYAREWAEEVNSWVDHMFAPENLEKHPGWRDLDLALRMEIWALSFDDFSGSPALDGRTLVNFLYALHYQGERIDGPIAAKAVKKVHNWAVMIQRSLLISFLRFPEFRESAKWQQNALDRLREYQQKVTLPDGVIAELIPSYHTTYPETFYVVRESSLQAGLKADFGEEYDRRIRNGVSAIMIWTHPDGCIPLFGDTFEGKKGRDYVMNFCRRYPEQKDWLWFATQGKEGKAPSELVHTLPDAGYYTMRTDWTTAPAVFIVMKNSFDKKGWGHNQSDNMTFELSFNGERVMVDSGAYIYISLKEERDWFRKSRRHQTVTLDGQDNARRGEKLFQKVFGDDLMVTALKNTPKRGLTHRRLFFLVAKKYIVVLDLLSGSAGGELRCHYQFTEGKHTFLPEQNRAFNRKIALTGAAGNGKMEEEEGWISRIYTKKNPRPAFAFVQQKEPKKTVEFLTMITPAGKPDFVPSIRLEKGSGRPDQGSFVLEPAPGEKYRITFDVRSESASCRKL